ncbi:Type 1 glutamine amidotransferase-like domain-containing protein [Saccharopolyspora sp. SCSIO 74807]|uniref:Type 1 glutamine amidotransferase-like domain-containing protein n=1 Tax=Saccharopolyspora sp. SCSIO 74807 TaxID=3118084 RepID=UPI0030D40EFB
MTGTLRRVRMYLSSFRVGNRPDELLRLSGTARPRTALIHNADDYKSEVDRATSLRRELHELDDVGLDPFEVDLRHYFGAERELRAVLGEVDVLYVRGGNVFVLRRAFRHSGAERVVPELLCRDALVYAGYSAGPSVLGPTLRGVEGHVDDPSCVPAEYPEEPPIFGGLGVLPYAIAPHFESDHPESAEIDRSIRYFITRHIPFIALRDGEAIVVEGDRRTVVG